MTKYLLIAIGVLGLLLSASCYYGYETTKSLAIAEQEVGRLELVIENKDSQILEAIAKNQRLTTKNSEISSELASNNAKALKDSARVAKIAKRKAKLYERLVNRDFSKLQKELVELTE